MTSAGISPAAANAPPKISANVFMLDEPWPWKATVSEPMPIAPKTAGMISIALDPWVTSPPITIMKMPPITNRIHQPVPFGQCGTGPRLAL